MSKQPRLFRVNLLFLPGYSRVFRMVFCIILQMARSASTGQIFWPAVGLCVVQVTNRRRSLVSVKRFPWPSTLLATHRTAPICIILHLQGDALPIRRIFFPIDWRHYTTLNDSTNTKGLSSHAFPGVLPLIESHNSRNGFSIEKQCSHPDPPV